MEWLYILKEDGIRAELAGDHRAHRLRVLSRAPRGAHGIEVHYRGRSLPRSAPSAATTPLSNTPARHMRSEQRLRQDPF